jgi:hypothetical protein
MPTTESPSLADQLAVEEYRALRATIRERGSLRMLVGALTFVSWAALAATLAALFVVPALGLLSLVVLAAGFEVVHAAHVGVERIGRYVEVRYENHHPTGPAWETTATSLAGRAGAGLGTDPLFSGLFVMAAVLNLIPMALMGADAEGGLRPLAAEMAIYFGLHLILVVRVAVARRAASGQRQRDLDLFRGRAGS